MEIWKESSEFNVNQWLAQQARFVLKKGWLFDVDILEICGQVNREEDTQREFPKQIETQNIESKITTKRRNTSILTQEDRRNIELMIRINCEQKKESRLETSLDWDRKSK